MIRQSHPDFPQHAELFADPEARGVWLGMQVIAAMTRAYARDGRAIFSDADLYWITKRKQAAAQRAMAERVAHSLGYTTHTLGAGLVVELRHAIEDPQWHYILGSGAQLGAAAPPPPPPVQRSLPGFTNLSDAFLIAKDEELKARQRAERARFAGRDRERRGR